MVSRFVSLRPRHQPSRTKLQASRLPSPAGISSSRLFQTSGSPANVMHSFHQSYSCLRWFRTQDYLVLESVATGSYCSSSYASVAEEETQSLTASVCGNSNLKIHGVCFVWPWRSNFNTSCRSSPCLHAVLEDILLVLRSSSSSVRSTLFLLSASVFSSHIKRQFPR